MFKQIGKVAEFLTGADEIGYFGKRLGRDIGSRKSRVKALWARAFPPIVSTPHDDPAEAFRRIAARNGVDEAEIEKRTRLHWRLFALWFVAVAVTVSFAIGTVRPALHSPIGIFGAIMPFLFAMPLSAFAVQHAFWHWQLRTRRVGSFKEWARQPRDWMPALLITATGSAAMLLSPGQAHAATSGLLAFTGTASGTAGTMIGTLLPGLLATPTPLTLAIGAFSALLMAYATSILAYGTLHSLIGTAHDGVPFGKDTHSLWGPVKAAFGMGMLAPAFPSGLSAVHGLVLVAAVMGSNAGDAVWTSYVNSVVTQAQPASPSAALLGVGVPESGLTVARNILRMEACRAVYPADQAAIQALGLPYYGTVPPQPSAAGTMTGTQQTWSYGQCGSVYLPAATGLTGAELTYQTARVAALTTLISAVEGTSLAADMAKAPLPPSTDENYRVGHIDSPTTAGATWPTAVVTPLTSPAQQYEVALSTAASAYMATKQTDARGKLVADAKTYGWMGAGLFYRDLGAINEGVSTLANTPPGYTKPRLLTYTRGSDQHADAVTHQLEADWAQQSAVNVVSGQDFAGPLDENSDLLTRLLAPVSHRIAQAITGLQSAIAAGADPMSTQMTFGHTVLDGAWVGVGGGALFAAGAGNWFSSAVGGAAAWEWVSKWGFLFIGGLFVVGSIHAYILPMMPYVFLLYASVSWITAIAEAMIAAPLWACMFLRWQGDNFIDGPQRAGANILLSILFRPAITLLAFCSTLTIWPMVINFFNATWSVGFVAQQGGHVVGLTGWIVGLGWGGLISYHLGLRVMGLTARTFDSIAGVWGGQPAGGGEHEQSHTVLGVATQQRAGVGRAMEAIKPNAPKKPDDKKPKDETEK